MKISLTGTFSVPRNELSSILVEAGHETCSLTKKTEVFLVGEKTSSAKKISKAKSFGVRIVQETNPQRILEILGDSSGGYREYHDRDGEIFVAGLPHVFDVFSDFVFWNQENGEWSDDDCVRSLEKFKEVEEILSSLAVRVIAEEEERFFAVFRRLLLISFINERFCDRDGDITVGDLGAFSNISQEEFLTKLLRLEFLDFSFRNESQEERLRFVQEEYPEWIEEVKDFTKFL